MVAASHVEEKPRLTVPALDLRDRREISHQTFKRSRASCLGNTKDLQRIPADSSEWAAVAQSIVRLPSVALTETLRDALPSNLFWPAASTTHSSKEKGKGKLIQSEPQLEKDDSEEDVDFAVGSYLHSQSSLSQSGSSFCAAAMAHQHLQQPQVVLL